MKNKNILLHLSLIKGIGAKCISLLTKNYSKIDNFYYFKKNDFLELGFSEEKSLLLHTGLSNKKILDDELKNIEHNQILWTTPIDAHFPKNLLSLDPIPSIFYIKANNYIPWNNYIWLSIVSSRKTNTYGQKAINEIISNLQNYPIGIISGGAIGGDTFVHENAIKYNLITVSILGCGLNTVYPVQNKKLFSSIVESGGALASHFSMSQIATKYTFPIRNAIIASLSDSLIVIQAGEKSGTLITAQYALEFGKSIGTIPGSIFDILSYGSHQLIKSGAECISSIEDIFTLLQIQIKKTTTHKDPIKKEISLEDNILASCEIPKHISELTSLYNIRLDIMQEVLYNLMIDNKITQDTLGNWIKK